MYKLSTLAALYLTLACTGPAAAAPQTPGEASPQPVALMGATLHPVDGPEIVGVLIFDQGRITALGADVAIPENALQIDLTGKHVYPGLIEAYSNLGLVEIESVRATRDQAETGQVNPNVRSQVAFNPDSELIPVARSGGVLCAVTAPTGGLISGTSSLMQLDGWTWEDMTVRAGTGLHIVWPRTLPVVDWITGAVEQSSEEARHNALRTIRETFATGRAYQAARQTAAAPGASPAPFDARWEGLLPVLAGQTPLVIHANEAGQIQSAVTFAAAEGLRLIIYGGYDAPLCAELLKRHDVPVIVSGVYRLPQLSSEPYDTPFTVPARLHAAGVRFCIASDEPAWNIRNLPYHAGTAAAFGLPPDIALAAVTLYPAQILGVADRLGSLAIGKEATLIVADGNPLEIATQVEAAYIQGRPLDLSNRQTQLWEKYREKYRRQGIGE